MSAHREIRMRTKGWVRCIQTRDVLAVVDCLGLKFVPGCCVARTIDHAQRSVAKDPSAAHLFAVDDYATLFCK